MKRFLKFIALSFAAVLLFGFTARMLALRWKLGLPVFHYTHDAH